MNGTLVSRRQFLTMALAAAPSLVFANAVALEQNNLRVNRIALPGNTKSCRFVHISDLHHRGDVGFADRIIRAVRNEHPDFVCFTGDLMDSAAMVDGALQFIRELGCPVYGVPGNHDHDCVTSFARFEGAFGATGGGWLMNRSATVSDRSIEIIGMDRREPGQLSSTRSPRQILLTHYPETVDRITGRDVTLVLAGHSHAGQIRLPLVGPVFLPEGVGRYDHGLFQTPAGTLHVSAGLGTSIIPVRFNCRPEITVFEI